MVNVAGMMYTCELNKCGPAMHGTEKTSLISLKLPSGRKLIDLQFLVFSM